MSDEYACHSARYQLERIWPVIGQYGHSVHYVCVQNFTLDELEQ
jgi:hypothetical protein